MNTECRKCDDEVAGCTSCSWYQNGILGTGRAIKCTSCRDGLGRSPTGECLECGTNCKRCDSAGLCDVCEDGFALGGPAVTEQGQVTPKVKTGGQLDRCWRCADNCLSCHRAGPMKCDKCMVDYKLVNDTQLCADASPQ